MNKLVVFFAVFAFGQTAPQKPVISDALRAQFWRVSLERQQVEMKFSKIMSEMQKQCGDGFTVAMDQSSEPVCSPVIPTTSVRDRQ